MAASSKQPWEVTDFSGGITDNQFSGETNSAYVMDNFFIEPDKKLLTRPGSVLDDAAHSPLPEGNLRIGALVNYARNDKLFRQSGRKFYYRPNADESGTYVTLQGTSGNDVLTAGTTSNFISTSEWNKQMFVVGDAFQAPMKIFKDGAGVYKVRNIGLPALANKPTVTAGAAGTNSYVYSFHYYYQYTVGPQSFVELGPTTFVQVTSAAPSTTANVITNIPVLANTGGMNYDTAEVRVVIYRTINNGQDGYKVTDIANGVTSYNDNATDTTIQNNLQLYTNDGTLDYYPAPKAKYVHVVGNIGYYGYTKDTDGEHPYRVHQSVPGNPGFVPQITYLELEDEVKGVGSVKALPIVFCKRLIYRIDGNFFASGQGAPNAVRIHASAGCISASSIVEAENYVFWAGIDGFYATDGYQVIKISDHLNPRYSTMLSATQNPLRIVGKFDETNRRVYWCVQQDASNLENDSLFALDLRWGVSPRSTFTTASGKSFRPTALEIFNGYLYRGDNNGFVFRHDPDVFTDPRVDTGVAATAWADETVLWNLTTLQFNFGSSFFRKFVSRILLQAGNAGNTTIQITAVNDQGRRTRDLKIIRWRRNFTWGDETVPWGNTDCVWNREGIIEEWRRFPAGGLRLSYLQLVFENGLGVIANSDSDGLCLVNKAAKTATLSTGTWPSQSVDYFLTLASDNYVRQYPVTVINNSKDTITVLDAGGNLPTDGTYEWELIGHAKGEPLNLLGYNLHWDNVDQNQGTFHTGDTGSNS